MTAAHTVPDTLNTRLSGRLVSRRTGNPYQKLGDDRPRFVGRRRADQGLWDPQALPAPATAAGTYDFDGFAG
jgi:hypothetical protein